MTERGGKPSRMSRRLRGYLGVVGRPSWMSGSGRNTLPEVLEGPLGCPGVVGGPPRYPRVVSCPPEYPGVVGRPCRMSASGGMPSWMSGSLHGCPGVFEKPSRMSGRTIQMFGRSSRMSVTVQKALPDIREALLNVRKWSRGSLGCPRVVRRPSRMSGSGRDALSDVREWLRGPPRCSGVVGRPSRMTGKGEKPSRMSRRLRGYLGVVGRPSWMSGSGQDTLPEVLKGPLGCLGVVRGPPGYPRVVKFPSRMSGSGQRPTRISESGQVALPNVREWWEALPVVRESSRMSGSVRKALPNVWEAHPDVR